MKNYNASHFFALFLLIFYGCDNNKKVSIADLNIKKAEEINFNSLVDSLHSIVLETERFDLSYCTDIRIFKDKIYCYSFSNSTIGIFNSNGKFLSQIGNHKSDKLNNPYGIYIEEDEQELWIIDDGTRINKYTLDGELKHIIKLPFESVDLKKHDEKFFYYTARLKSTVNSYILNYNEKEGDISEYLPVNWNIKRHGNITSDVFAMSSSGLYFLLPAKLFVGFVLQIRTRKQFEKL